MKRPLRFYVLVLPNLPWPELVERFRQVETLGFDLAGFADHFVDWSKPQNHWYELSTWLAGIAQATSRIRLLTTVAQIPLRDPATLANQMLTVDHISNCRLEIGLGIGVKGLDPSYRMMGLPDWSNKERVVNCVFRRDVAFGSSVDGAFLGRAIDVMQQRSCRGSGEPAWVTASNECAILIRDPIRGTHEGQRPEQTCRTNRPYR